MSPKVTEPRVWEELAEQIFRIVGPVRYGSIEVTIHDSRVVQLETSQKYRLPPRPAPGSPGAISSD